VAESKFTMTSWLTKGLPRQFWLMKENNRFNSAHWRRDRASEGPPPIRRRPAGIVHDEPSEPHFAIPSDAEEEYRSRRFSRVLSASRLLIF
jgi:hypothetical protein